MRSVSLFFFVFLSLVGYSQTIRIEGRVRDPHGQGIPNAIIVNNRTKTGSFGNSSGYYTIVCEKTDTLSITALSYYTRQLCMKDSLIKEVYYPTIFLDDRTYMLPVVEFISPRDLEAIEEDLMSLGFDENQFKTASVSSPITFLYEQFSKRERSKLAVAKMEYEDRKRALLKELFHLYVDYDIIELTNDEFDAFIDFMHVSNEFIRQSSQYEFLIFVKEEFQQYKIWKRGKREWKDDDFNYDKD
ncbi:MAG: carboxypeptidase-like regulatory domain-containing protein [Flavobacteriales bacterium]|nr:carboxypeptidase-like regulatory domain-containing protein [Flavobacteriales bacterium]